MENSSDYRVGSPFAPGSVAETTTAPAAADAMGSASDETASTTTAVEGRSPFQAEPSTSNEKATQPPHEPETLGHGVWTETAAAAAYAALIVLGFALACLLLFPAGGIAVAALGAVLSLLGLSSRRVRLSVTTLVLHGVLFFVCYLRAI